MPEASQKVAETVKITKTAPKPSSKAGEKPEKSSWNWKNPQNIFQNSAQKPEKSREKVAETAEITKTAPKLSPKARKKPAKTRQKVAEITINPKTA